METKNIILELRKVCEKLPEALEKIAPVLIYPVVGILIMGLLMLCFNMLADGLRDALDPKMKDM